MTEHEPLMLELPCGLAGVYEKIADKAEAHLEEGNCPICSVELVKCSKGHRTWSPRGVECFACQVTGTCAKCGKECYLKDGVLCGLCYRD